MLKTNDLICLTVISNSDTQNAESKTVPVHLKKKKINGRLRVTALVHERPEATVVFYPQLIPRLMASLSFLYCSVCCQICCANSSGMSSFNHDHRGSAGHIKSCPTTN